MLLPLRCSLSWSLAIWCPRIRKQWLPSLSTAQQEHEQMLALGCTAHRHPQSRRPSWARILPASAAGYQLPGSAALSAVSAGVEGGRQALPRALLVGGMVTVRQPCDSCHAGSPTAALAVALQKDWCARVSPALPLLSQSLEKWVAVRTGQNACLAKGRLVRADLACRLLVASHLQVARSTLCAFCRFSQQASSWKLQN